MRFFSQSLDVSPQIRRSPFFVYRPCGNTSCDCFYCTLVHSAYRTNTNTMNSQPRFHSINHNVCKAGIFLRSIHEWKYPKPHYYRHILHTYFQQNPFAEPQNALNDINQLTTLPWKYSSFKKVCQQIKKDVQNGIGSQLLPSQFKKTTKNKYKYKNMAADQLHSLFDNLNEPDILMILNKYSGMKYMKYGDAILARKCIESTHSN